MISGPEQPIKTRAALAFLLSDKGNFFREFILDEIVKAIDAVSRDQLVQVATALGIRNPVPVFGMAPIRTTALLPTITAEEKVIVNNVEKVVKFLIAGTSNPNSTSDRDMNLANIIQELLPVLPGISAKVLPDIMSRLSSRIFARIIREVFS